MNERYKAIVSSSNVDKHGDVMTKEALEQMVDFINCKDKMIRFGVDHRKDFPPKGRVENGTLIEKDGVYFVEAEFVPYEKTEIVSWNNNLISQSFSDSFQFAEVQHEEIENPTISIDPNNFSSFEEVESFCEKIKQNDVNNLKINFMGRKSAIPDPEIVFGFTSSLLFYHFLKPTAKKLGEKVADKIAEKGLEQFQKIETLIEKSIKELFYRCIPKARPVTVVFDFPGKPHIELIARTTDQKLILKSLKGKQLQVIKEDIKSLSEHVKIAKVQFLLSNKGKWDFNYLITENGETIGKKVAFEKREHRLEIINQKKVKRK
jgi:hypothetical protein